MDEEEKSNLLGFLEDGVSATGGQLSPTQPGVGGVDLGGVFLHFAPIQGVLLGGLPSGARDGSGLGERGGFALGAGGAFLGDSGLADATDTSGAGGLTLGATDGGILGAASEGLMLGTTDGGISGAASEGFTLGATDGGILGAASEGLKLGATDEGISGAALEGFALGAADRGISGAASDGFTLGAIEGGIEGATSEGLALGPTEGGIAGTASDGLGGETGGFKGGPLISGSAGGSILPGQFTPLQGGFDTSGLPDGLMLGTALMGDLVVALLSGSAALASTALQVVGTDVERPSPSSPIFVVSTGTFADGFTLMTGFGVSSGFALGMASGMSAAGALGLAIGLLPPAPGTSGCGEIK